jgi:hypothetical protein
MLCEGAERPPEGREWRYELKLDGFRAIGRKSGHVTQFWWVTTMFMGQHLTVREKNVGKNQPRLGYSAAAQTDLPPSV